MAWTAAAIAGSAALGYLSADNAADAQKEGTDKAVASTERESERARADLAPYKAAGTAALSRLQNLLGMPDARAGQPDWNAYLSANPDVAADPYFGKNPDVHYYNWGSREGRKLPLIQSGTATPGYGDLLRKFTPTDLNADPVYNSGLDFGLNEGTKALERRASSMGGYDSGGTLKALTRFANDYGSTKAGESYGRFTNDQDRTFGKLSGVAGMGSGATSVGVNAGANAGNTLASLYSGEGNALGASAIAKGNAVSGGLNSYLNYSLLSQLTGGGQRKATPTTDPNDYYNG